MTSTGTTKDKTPGPAHAMAPETAARARPLIVIYGGMHKTGTSANQNTLYENLDLLNAGGVDIVRTGLQRNWQSAGVRHLPLSREIVGARRVGPRWKEAAAEIAKGEFSTYILMHETFFGPTVSPKVLCSVLPDADIRMVACIRNPIDYINSQYRERIHRAGETREPAAFIEASARHLATDVLRRKWVAQIGAENLTVIPYEMAGRGSRTILRAILAGTSVDPEALTFSTRTNRSIDHWRCLEHLMSNRLRAAGQDIPKSLITGSPALRDRRPVTARLLSDQDMARIAQLSDVPGDVIADSKAALLPLDANFRDPVLRRRLLRDLQDDARAQAVRPALLTLELAKRRHISALTSPRSEKAVNEVRIDGDTVEISVLSAKKKREDVTLVFLEGGLKVASLQRVWPDDFEPLRTLGYRANLGTVRIAASQIGGPWRRLEVIGDRGEHPVIWDSWNSTDALSFVQAGGAPRVDPATVAAFAREGLDMDQVAETERSVMQLALGHAALGLMDEDLLADALTRIRAGRTAPVGMRPAAVVLMECHLLIATGAAGDLAAVLNAWQPHLEGIHHAPADVAATCRVFLLCGYLELMAGNRAAGARHLARIVDLHRHSAGPVGALPDAQARSPSDALWVALQYLDPEGPDPFGDEDLFDRVFDAFQDVRWRSGRIMMAACFRILVRSITDGVPHDGIPA